MMHRRLIHICGVLFCVAVGFFSCSKEPVHIHGNISRLPNGMVYLRAYEGVMRTIDSTASTEGRFTFLLPEIVPNILYLQFENYPDFYIPIMIDGGEVSVSGNFSYHDDIQVSGTASNDALWKYRESVRKYDIMIQAIDLQLGDSTAMDSVERGQLFLKRDSLERIIANSKTNFVRHNRKSIVSAMFVSMELTDSTSDNTIDSLLNELDPDMPDNAFIQKLRRRRDALNL